MSFTSQFLWKFTSIALFLIPLIIILSSSSVSSRPLEDGNHIREMYEQWIATYGRTYKDNEEKERCFLTFKANVEYIEAFNNANNHTYRLGINQFADMTNEEFRAKYTGLKMPSLDTRSSNSSFMYENVTQVPSSIDWRAKGAVTPVKNQGQCGSCWAFSTVAAVEGITKLSAHAHKLISLSEQELVDCDTKGDDQGCNGGEMVTAFKYIIHNHGLVPESKYPYKGIDEECHKKWVANPVAKISGYEDIPKKNEGALLKAVAHQPVSVGIDASYEFQMYESGVFHGDCETTLLNHAVTVVGYGTTTKNGNGNGSGKKYWLVKNSWGEKWGEKGYIRMERDVDAKEGLCGITMLASYPTIKAKT